MHTNLVGLHKSVSLRLLVLEHGMNMWLAVTWDLTRHEQKSNSPLSQERILFPSVHEASGHQAIAFISLACIFCFPSVSYWRYGCFILLFIKNWANCFTFVVALMVAELGSKLPNQFWLGAKSEQGLLRSERVHVWHFLSFQSKFYISTCSIPYWVFSITYSFFFLIILVWDFTRWRVCWVLVCLSKNWKKNSWISRSERRPWMPTISQLTRIKLHMFIHTRFSVELVLIRNRFSQDPFQ